MDIMEIRTYAGYCLTASDYLMKKQVLPTISEEAAATGATFGGIALLALCIEKEKEYFRNMELPNTCKFEILLSDKKYEHRKPKFRNIRNAIFHARVEFEGKKIILFDREPNEKENWLKITFDTVHDLMLAIASNIPQSQNSLRK